MSKLPHLRDPALAVGLGDEPGRGVKDGDGHPRALGKSVGVPAYACAATEGRRGEGWRVGNTPTFSVKTTRLVDRGGESRNWQSRARGSNVPNLAVRT